MVSFWRVLRLIFVIFSLYLVADAIYRWSSFRHHSSFAEFLPSIALITILWSIVAVLTAIVICFTMRSVQWFGLYIFKSKQLTSYIGIILVCGAIVWQGHKFIWPYVQTSLQLRLAIFVSISILSIFLSSLFHSRIERWMGYIHDQISIWIWLFSIWVLFSMPVVIYYTWLKDPEQTVSNTSSETFDAEKHSPNIILFTFDGLTAQDMSVYGYRRETTPFIKKWAKKATVFTNAKAESARTTLSVASLMTGQRPWTNHILHMENQSRPDIESVPYLLKNAGYYNMAFVTNGLASVRGMGMLNSFMVAPYHYDLISPTNILSYLKLSLYKLFGTKIKLYDWILKEDFILYMNIPNNLKYSDKTKFPIDMLMTEIDNDKLREPYFAWIHVWFPHFPGLPPEEYIGLFDSSQKFRSLQSQLNLALPRYFTKDQQPDADILRARYNEIIRYCDKQFQNFIERLKEKDHLNPPVIILSSDHGESFEHGFFTHGGPFLFEQMTHVPLIIKKPKQSQGKIVNIPVEQIDTAATILDFAGISAPSWVEGRSLEPLLRGNKFQPMPVFSMISLGEDKITGVITDGIIAVWEGNYKLIHYLKKGKSLLFNLKEDPEEMDNLIERQPEVGKHLLELIRDNLKNANEKFRKG